MVTKKTKEFLHLLNSVNPKELFDIEEELNHAAAEEDDQELVNSIHVVRNIIKKINAGTNAQAVIRNGINEIIQDSYSDNFVFSKKSLHAVLSDQEAKHIIDKQEQVYNILERLEEHVSGKEIDEAVHIFSSLVNIISQICTRRSNGLISVRVQLDDFFRLHENNGSLKPEYKRTVHLQFSPEEVTAMQMQMPELKKDDPMARFFTYILHHACDIVRFNEMTGYLLLIMSSYFLDKLQDDEKLLEYTERHEHAASALNKAVEDLCEVEQIIFKHLEQYPVLTQFPRYVRALINDKLGLPCIESPDYLSKKIYSLKDEYSRVQSTVAFDFNRLHPVQRTLFVRQKAVLNLQKDIINHLHQKQKDDIDAVKKELDEITRLIETRSADVNQDSIEFENLISQKRLIEKKIEESRRRLDVLRSQFSLIDIQQKLIQDAIERTQTQTTATDPPGIPKRIAPKPNATTAKKKTHGMVNPKKLQRGRR